MSDGNERHAWVFQVLQDLRDYALANGLPALADRAAEALEVAREEIGDEQGPEPGADLKH